MRTLASASVFCLLVPAGAQAGNQDALKKETDLLRGTWSGNVSVGADEVKGQFVIYGDESFESNLGGNRVNGARKIDPAKNPKEIALTPDRSNKSLLGIYKLEGDTLTLCVGEKRPTEFKAKEETTLWVLKRDKKGQAAEGKIRQPPIHFLEWIPPSHGLARASSVSYHEQARQPLAFFDIHSIEPRYGLLGVTKVSYHARGNNLPQKMAYYLVIVDEFSTDAISMHLVIMGFREASLAGSAIRLTRPRWIGRTRENKPR
jgi:uncharacterized protein (TIGR03067 family)